MDIFTSEDVRKLLHNKFVCVIGDSIQRGVYKDLVFLLQNNKYLLEFMLKQKGERRFCLDELVEGGTLGEMHNGKSYREVRQYKSDYYLLRYYYITRCYSQYLETIILDFEAGPKPDVIIMNSCVWDITRYGPDGFDDYKANLQCLFKRLRASVPETCLCIWLTTLPIGSHVRGGFLLPELDFYNETLRFDVVISNFHSQQVAEHYGIDVLDLHHHFRELTQWRKGDGIHWNYLAHRRITQLILTHICESWGVGLPQRNPLRDEWEQYMHHDELYGQVQDENTSRSRPNRRHERSNSCVSDFSHLTNQREVNNNVIPPNRQQYMVNEPNVQDAIAAAMHSIAAYNSSIPQLPSHQHSWGGGPTRNHQGSRHNPYRK